MPSQVKDILTRVRDSLSDPKKSRWSDQRLIRLIDEAQKNLVKEAQLLRAKTVVAVVALQNEYVLPSDAFLLTRVVNQDGAPITVTSHDKMDNNEATPGYTREWENDTGIDVTKVIFDKMNPRTFKVYPIPLESDGGEVFINSDYGIVAAVEGDIVTPDYGIIGTVSSNAIDTVEINSAYGVVAEMSSTVTELTVYYRRLPVELTDEEDFLEVESVYDTAIKHYVVGMALFDDQDTQNTKVGLSVLKFYQNDLGTAVKTSKKDNKSNSYHESSYNRGI